MDTKVENLTTGNYFEMGVIKRDRYSEYMGLSINNISSKLGNTPSPPPLISINKIVADLPLPDHRLMLLAPTRSSIDPVPDCLTD